MKRDKAPDTEAADLTTRESEKLLGLIYDTVTDVIFYLAVESESRFRFLSVNTAFLRVTGMSAETVVGRTVDEVIPEPSLTVVLDKYREAIQSRAAVSWEETSDYPRGRLIGEVTIAPIFDGRGTCTHLVGSVHDITRRKQTEVALREREQQLLQSQMDLRSLMARLTEVQESGMREVAREMHDVFSQQLAAVAIELSMLERDCIEGSDIAPRLSALREEVVKLAADIHDTSRELHPAIIEDLGLVAALRQECDSFERTTGIRIRFRAPTIPPKIPWGPSLCLYRVAQESLHNVRKHAPTTKIVSISLIKRAPGIALRLQDAGKGFDLHSVRRKGGLGLISMDERVRLAGGKLSIETQPGKGTIVTAFVPLVRS